MTTGNLAHYIHAFFHDYLTAQKGLSRNTVLSYRDTIKQLLLFAATERGKVVTNLSLDDLGLPVIMRFLDHIESQRGNAIATRNNRLACIHCFFQYIANCDPVLFEQSQQIVGIPFKRNHISTVEYLEVEEMKAFLNAIDHAKPDGRRDYALFSFMYNTGARVQEVADLRSVALQLDRPYQVRILGKGNKERICPLWEKTADLIRSLMRQRGIDPKLNVPIFVNHNGQRFTRHGINYLLAKYVRVAVHDCPSLERKNIHPHTIRHTTAMHLLQSGVDINTIRAWLGHVDLKTTNRYAEINLEMKRKVLNKYLPLAKSRAPWKNNHQIIQWLESL
jgi:site-specific recombinase XerD